MSEPFVSTARIAKELGVVPSAVGNWQRRGVLPTELQPVLWVDHGTPYPTPVWQRSQLALFTEWYRKRSKP